MLAMFVAAQKKKNPYLRATKLLIETVCCCDGWVATFVYLTLSQP